jgi:hypothetical protein
MSSREASVIIVPANPWTDKEFFEQWCHLSSLELGRRFGGGDTVWRKWRKRHGLPAATEKADSIQNVIVPASELSVTEPVVMTLDEKIERDKRVARLEAANKELQALYGAALKSANIYDDIKAEAHEHISRIEPIKLVAPVVHKSKTVEDAILDWADWHGGEVIRSEVMQGYNSYDPSIMCRRAQSTVDKTLDLLFGNHSGTKFETLYVFDLGDGVAGDLLVDNAVTNAMGVFPSMTFVADVKSRALTELSAHIKVVYVSVPGNHGRRGQKMPWKQPQETADWLIANMIRDRCDQQSNITVEIPEAWTAVVNVRGFNHSLNHGYAAAKGGYGGIPWYAFQRADGKKTALESAHGQRIHFRHYGHIHTPAELPKMDGTGSQFITGTLAGGNEYALEELNAYSEPTQLLIGCHEKYGTTWRYPLQVNHSDHIPSRYEDAILTVPHR